MESYALTYPLLYRRRPRAFFLIRKAHQVKSMRAVLGEIGRALVALGGLAAWGGLLLVFAG
ncbi:MAG TPA: hypothetical protein VGL09_06705 [Methylomirabilota bacterium]|jgi:hypothetical protein